MEGLCSIKLELDQDNPSKLLSLIQELSRTAKSIDNPIHLSRALSLQAAYFSQQGNIKKALKEQQQLKKVYKVQQHSEDMVKIYGKDYALECFSQSIFWFSLAGDTENASRQAEFVIRNHLPYQDPQDIDNIMVLILPAVLMFKSTGRAIEADYVMKKHVINAFHQLEERTSHWVEMFNPICYLLEIVKMEDEHDMDTEVLKELEEWVLNNKNSYYSSTNVRLGHRIMGEICYRLGSLKKMEDPMRGILFAKAKLFLNPIVRDTNAEPYLARSAFHLLRVL